MSTLYIHLPPKAAADSVPHWVALICPFALVAHGGAIEREGAVPLSNLSDTIAKAQRVVVMIAASDTTLLRVQVPPLSPARLKAALPNLVEDQLIADPSDCVVVAGGISDGLRTVAVVQRAWLTIIAKTLTAFDARHIVALPAQLCLPYQPGNVTAAINEQNVGIDVTLRLSEQDGIGLAIVPALNHPETSKNEVHEQHEASVHEVVQTLCAVVPDAPIALYVPQSLAHTYQEILSNIAVLNGRVSVFSDNWSRWIAGANSTTLDLMVGLGAGAAPRLNWREWRWSLAMSAAALLINIAALNIDWWRMSSEANSLRASMIRIYKSVYPKETVIIDPIAQMQQKIASARNSGMTAPDSFIALIAAFSETWASVAPAPPTGGRASAITALEYHERSLLVRFKPGSEAPTQLMATALAKRNLSLNFALGLAPEQSGAIVWQIRSAK